MQANQWLKNLYKKANIQVFKFNDIHYLRTLEQAIRFGTPALLEDVNESLDVDIEPLLLKQTFKKGGQLLIRLNERDISYSNDFKFFITTKLSNPHYLPETFVKVTIINFTVTKQGLTDQLLVVVCSMERPDLEDKKDALTVQIATDQDELYHIQDKILTQLSETTGDILDDIDLIQMLSASKSTSIKINQRIQQANHIIQEISAIRDEYRILAIRASILYFVIAQLSQVDPMYQYSLSYFIKLICQRIKQAELVDHNKQQAVEAVPEEDGPEEEDGEEEEKDNLNINQLKEHISYLTTDITHAVYNQICIGLFEKDKLLFSFLIATSIERNNDKISAIEWNFFY